MAKLEIELAPEEQEQIQQAAERARLPLGEWVRFQLLKPPLPAFITDEGEVFDIPDLPEDLGRACALASEATLRKILGYPRGGCGMAGYVKGDVVLAPFPLSGEESFKVRPALVMATLPYKQGNDCLLCVITTQKVEDPYLLHLDSSDLVGGHLTQECYLRPAYTYVVSEHIVKRRLGRLTEAKLQAAIQSLVFVLTK